MWLNYNSSKVLPLVLHSLRSIADLDYPSDRYELMLEAKPRENTVIRDASKYWIRVR